MKNEHFRQENSWRFYLGVCILMYVNKAWPGKPSPTVNFSLGIFDDLIFVSVLLASIPTASLETH